MPVNVNEWVGLGVLAVVGLLALGTLIYLGVGLFQARSLIRRELTAYFVSPVAYVVLVVFLAMTGHLFVQMLDQLTARGPRGVEYPMRVMLGDERFWLVFLFIPPLLTMRLFAEERSTGTLETLMTTPLRDWQVALSKYVACYVFYVVLWLPTLVYTWVLLDMRWPPEFSAVWTPFSIALVAGLGAVLLSIVMVILPGGTGLRLVAVVLFLVGLVAAGLGGWGHYIGFPFGDTVLGGPEEPVKIFLVRCGIDPMPALTSYVGLALAGAMFLAIGLLVSSLVRSQMVAALVTLVLCLVFIVAGFWRPDLESVGQGVFFFSVPLHFSRDFSRGLIDTRHIVLYASVAVFALFLTVRSLESRRWR
jgi:ABC-type transport system involved in multi-copper enzyme maturation permease subunit